LTSISTQFDASATGGCLDRRCEQIGVTLVHAEPDGRITTVVSPDSGWLEKLVAESAIFAAVLARHAADWAEPGAAHPMEIWPGCWVVPLPIMQRRRCVGFEIALLLTDRLLGSEQFVQICSAAGLDHTVMVGRARHAPFVREAEIRRLARMLHWMSRDVDRLERHVGEIDLLSSQLSESYEELSLLYKLSANMVLTKEPAGFLDEACQDLQQVAALKWLALQLVDTDDRLDELKGRLIVAGDPPCDRARLGEVGGELLAGLGEDRGPRICEHGRHTGVPGLGELSDRMLIVPLIREDEPLGVLVGAEKIDDTELSSVDSKLANSLAQNICIFLENAMLYEDMQEMFMGTLHALISSIDAKDTYTCGHSERVALLSRQLALAAGIDEETAERIYLAGLVHDVGKIGVPESVLCKPGRLTRTEFELIKLHPEIGAKILKDIRQMKDLLPGVLHHHERYDGKGYPHGLAGEDIPLFGQVICLADSFDAMSTNRTYRAAMPREEVLEEMRRCAGTQFEAKLASVFVTLDFEPFDEMVVCHQHREAEMVSWEQPDETHE